MDVNDELPKLKIKAWTNPRAKELCKSLWTEAIVQMNMEMIVGHIVLDNAP
jgi:hypothetical protein